MSTDYAKAVQAFSILNQSLPRMSGLTVGEAQNVIAAVQVLEAYLKNEAPKPDAEHG